MAEISIGPGGYQVSGSPCANNTFLADQNNPLGALKETLTIQHITGIKTMLYPPMAAAIDRHMPLRDSTATRVDGVIDYRSTIGYDNLLNSTELTDVTPSSSPYTDNRSLQTACGNSRNKGISSSTNGNAEGCNPVIDGPVPIIGREEYSRRGYNLRLPIPPICFTAFTNKEKFHDHLSGMMRAVRNATMTAFAAGQYRWTIEKSRFNASPIQVARNGGRATLPVSADLFSNGTFGRVPEHWGSPDWIAAMLRESEIDPNQDVTVELPASIFKKYKEELAIAIGLNVFEQASNLTNALNGFTRTILNDTLIYQDEVTGRKLTFIVTRTPVYVEVEDVGPGLGNWYFQEPWIFRDSETANQVYGRSNPKWGVACSCEGRTLAAIITVSADNGPKPFYKEPFPENPDTQLRSLISQYGGNGSEVNTNLRQLYPTSVETRIFTGIEAQVWLLDPMNRRFREGGFGCDIGSNVDGTWIGGFTKISGVFVENDPRTLTHFLLKVPSSSRCVELSVPCDGPVNIPEGGEIDPGITPLVKQVLPVPDPIPLPPAEAGLIQQIGRATNIMADCTETTEVTIRFRRVGGSAGAISINVTADPVDPDHIGTIPATVNFADGQLESTLVLPIDPWAASPQETETTTLTFSGASLDPDTYSTRTICVRSNDNCPGVCDPLTGVCGSCG